MFYISALKQVFSSFSVTNGKQIKESAKNNKKNIWLDKRPKTLLYKLAIKPEINRHLPRHLSQPTHLVYIT